MAYKFISEAPWNILHWAHIWHQTVFQHWSKFLMATCLKKIVR